MCSSDMLRTQRNALFCLKGLTSLSMRWSDERFAKAQHDACKHHLVKVIWPWKLAPILENTSLKRLTVVSRHSDLQAMCSLRKGIRRSHCQTHLSHSTYPTSTPGKIPTQRRTREETERFATWCRPSCLRAMRRCEGISVGFEAI